MTEAIVRETAPITLIGGGDVTRSDLAEALAHAPVLVAIDGGADQALALGAQPQAVIGDFDSVSDHARTALSQSILHLVAEQETTDFDKALRSVEAPLVLAVGVLGARLDHQLAALHVLMQPHAKTCILIGAHEVVVHLTASLELELQAGDVVSLFPLLPVSGRSDGLEWPIDGLELSPLSRIGTSNRATGSIRIEVDGPGLLAILPRHCLGALIQVMQAGPSC
ncbi:thiamine pyrophosphokinase [Ruegeria sp. TM1040]|uniref:thiamine diphosphokinase n=1 Tax=Ruegeria sp. (strain TM1040) TaxID=292414 RepID=UPI0000463071|nr:thiamine diphosphokinase [Ruegeria sp. TM1040]ABF64698.1 thiamine pyrophosphokinase [Ruegeria sp. TM1040]MDF9303277.1 thiamine diphosphokinase [Tritonibacter mobilis]